MSCAVGLAEGGTVWIGADSAASGPNQSVTYTGPKVFRRGSLLFGAVGSFRLRDILLHDLSIPRRKPGQSDEAFLVNRLIEEIRTTLDAGKFDLAAEAKGAAESGLILLGFHGRLFTVDWDLHVDEVRDHYSAIGSGQDFALGSLYTSERPPKVEPPQARVRRALEASAHFSPTAVRPPFRILSVR